jgi:hypothetical protein
MDNFFSEEPSSSVAEYIRRSEAKIMKQENWPSILIKAVSDHWRYLMVLRSGEEMVFTDAKYINKDWVEIELEQDSEKTKLFHDKHSFYTGRGVEIRVSEIQMLVDQDS